MRNRQADHLLQHWVVRLEKETSEATMDDQFKLRDLVVTESTKEEEIELKQERELLKPLPKPLVKSRTYSHTHFDKTKIKTSAVIQHEQQRERAEKLLEQDVEPELMQEEVEKHGKERRSETEKSGAI